MEIVFNDARALEVLKTLSSHWHNKDGPFVGAILQEDQLNFSGSADEVANRLAIRAIFMRGGINSDTVLDHLDRIYEQCPDLFVPQNIVKNYSPQDLIKALQAATAKTLATQGAHKAGTFGHKLYEHCNSWRKNCEYIVDQLGGSILNAYKRPDNSWVYDFEEAFARIENRPKRQGLVGMRRKIFALLTLWLQHTDSGKQGFIPKFPTPLPIDIHAMRILIQTGAVAFKDVLPYQIKNPQERRVMRGKQTAKIPPCYNGRLAVRIRDQIITEITKWSMAFLAKHNIATEDANRALWVYSRAYCSFHPQARFVEKDNLFRDPEVMRKNPQLWARNPCDFCPVEHLCTLVLPTHPYIRAGLLITIERAQHPHPLLPGTFHPSDWRNSRILRKVGQ